MVTGFFGVPGCGKTTFMARFATKEIKKIKKNKSKYKYVLTNFYCKGCYQINYSDLGHYDITDCLILLDEITLDADSRDFKMFDKYHKDFFLMHRHDRCDIIYFTQQYDGVDKKIRDITFSIYFVSSSRILPISKAKRIFRCLDINEMTKEIVQGYRFPVFWDYLFGTSNTIYCWRPRWYKYFDSFEKSELQKQRSEFSFVPWDLPVNDTIDSDLTEDDSVS